MENQSEKSPRLVVLKLDNGELVEDLTPSNRAASEAG